VNEFLTVLLIAGVAALLTYLGAPVAERYDAPQRVVSAALQFAGGIIAALVAFSLMPPAVRDGPLLLVVLAFFLGGALFVVIEYFAAQRQSGPAAMQAGGSPGFYIGILADLLIDGVVIGVGATLTLKTGLLLALGMAISTAPLAYVTIATAKQHGMPRETRQRLAYLFFICVLGGAILGYGFLRNQPEDLKMILIALSAGFLITTVTQSIIPEANREGEPSFAGILFVAGISIYALLTLVVQ
jgi:ZIP family zinc transporter